MRVCAVIGGTGFIGAELVSGLRGAGDREVIVVGRRPPEGDRSRHVVADMRDRAALARVFHGVDTVIHLGATIPDAFESDPAIVREGNRAAAVAIVGACEKAGVKSLIYVTGHLSPPPESSPDELAFLHGKIAAEEIILAANREGGLATTSVRAPVIFGPGDKITDRYVRGRAPVFPRFSRTFSFMYVGDLVALLLRVEEAISARRGRFAGEAVDVRGEPMTFEQFLSLPAWGRSPPVFVPYRAVRWLCEINGILARVAGCAPLGASMCSAVMDVMAFHHRREEALDAASALGIAEADPPSVVAGIRATLARQP